MVAVTVTGCGLVTAVGFSATATLAAIRAGVSGISEVNLWDYESGEFITGGRVRLPQWEEGLAKYADLAASAILECFREAEPVRPEEIPIILGLAAPSRAMRSNNLDEHILEEISVRLKVKLHPASRVNPQGQVSTLASLLDTQQHLEDERLQACIVAGVDSFLDRNAAHEFMERRRLFTPSNSNGFIPGEAGSAILVQRVSDCRRGGLHILGIGMGYETATIESEEPLRGDGLAQAIRNALAQCGLTIFDAAYRITDINGEQYKFKEAAFAAMRFEHGQRRKELFDLWHPTEYIGEVGAAIGPLVLAVALHAGESGYAPGPTALCHFGNDDGERAAALVRYKQAREVQ